MQLDLLDHGVLSLRETLAAADISFQQRLFDVLFVWQENVPSNWGNFNLVQVNATRDYHDYAMVIEAEPRDSEVVLKLSYNTKKLSSLQARYFLRQLDFLVAEIIANPGVYLDEIWNSCDPEILAIANITRQTFENPFDLVSTIRTLSETSPDQAAISFIHDFDPQAGSTRIEKLAYGELWQQSRQMAHFLRDSGTGENDIVCVILDKSIDLYVLNLAIVMAGGAFLNVDVRTPSERINQILSQVNCKLLIRGDEIGLSPAFDITDLLCIPLVTAKAGARQYCGQSFNPQPKFGGSTLAYVVMTSGTTGNPKAILVTRENLLSNIKTLSRKYPRYEGQNTLLQACSPAFDVYVFELFWTLHMGFCLYSGTNDILFRDIEAFIRAGNVTHLSLTPSVAALVQPDNVPSVKFLVTAGEPMNSKVFNDWAGHGLFQGYGPAETTNISNVKGPVQQDGVSNNVGAPLENTSIFVCVKQHDDLLEYSLQILPLGAVGEIVIGGDQVARGYADQSLTARSFIDTKYGRLYRSGDLGRLLANGDLVVLGREDDQVKLRGQRIELGDINATLTKIPFVKDAVTVHIGENSTTARLISFWTASSTETPLDVTTNLYELLEASLSPYLIPDALVCLDDFPLTKQGKTDKRMLIQYYQSLDAISLRSISRGDPSPGGHGGFSEQEQSIAQALADTTNMSVSEFDPNTSFYALGIDSISAVRLSQKLRELNLGKIDISFILRHCSVRRLCRAMSENTRSGIETGFGDSPEVVFEFAWRQKVQDLVMAQGYRVEEILPCTALQDSILAVQAHKPGSSAYEARLTFEIRNDIDILRAAWSDMIHRHQILRTGFLITHSADHAYAQVVLEDMELAWLTPGQKILMPKTKSPEDFIYPPWHLELDYGSTGRSPSLALVMSHVLYDFDALAILLRDVELRFKSQQLKPVAPPNTYFHYMLQLDREKADAFWRKILKGYQPRSLFQRPQSSEGVGVSRSRPKYYLRTSNFSQHQMRVASEQYSATPATLFQAAWGRLLSCYTNSNDVVFGSIFSGRNLPIEGVADIVAPLFNTLPLRIQLHGRYSMRELVTAIQTTVLQIIAFQPSPLRRIVRGQNLGKQSLFDTLVLVQSGGLNLDKDIWTLKSEQGDMDFRGIIIEILPDAKIDKLVLKLHVQCESISSFTALQILEHFEQLLNQIMFYPQAQASDFGSVQCNLPMLQDAIRSRSETTLFELAEDLNEGEHLTDLEMDIRNLFSRLSSVSTAKIKTNTSIFEIGLDSLHIIQIASCLRENGYHITGADVLEGKTIAKLSKICLSNPKRGVSIRNQGFDLDAFDQKHRQTICDQLHVASSDIQSVWPCTPTQSGILTEFINSKGDLYFNSVTLELSKDTNLQRLRDAWQYAMERNDILRTGFVILSTSAHAYAMVTYSRGSQALPWLIQEDYGRESKGSFALSCLENLHEPCWRLLLKQNTGHTHLEFHALHSLYDANSFDYMLSEVAARYRGQELQLPNPAPIGFGLCTILSESELRSETSAEFWSQIGAGASSSRFPHLNIHQCVDEKSIMRRREFTGLLSDLREGCRRLDVSLQSVCQVAWARLLAAYTGERKVMFGVILSGRNLPELANVLFPTINTVPFAIEVGTSMETMLSESTELNVGLLKNQFTPNTAIKEWLATREKLFDTVLVLQGLQSNERNDRTWKIVEDRATAEYTISMEVFAGFTDDVELRITSRPNIIPPEHAELLLRQYEKLLRQTVDEGFDKLTAEQGLLSVVAAKDEHIQTKISLLHDFVDETARRIPNAIALEFAYSLTDNLVDKRCWSYRQLNEESNRITHLLLVSGVEPGDFIAICFDKCPEASFAILAVLKVGCAYVAIDPSAPIARKRFILEDASCKVLLTTKNLVFSLESNNRVMILAMDDPDIFQSQQTSAPVLKRKILPSDTCYCLYTSGTTGQPKGCLISHTSAVQAMLSFQRIFAGSWDKNSRWLQFASFHFDVSVLEQYWSWSVGICVTSAPRDVLFEDIAGAIDALQITHLDLTPSLARLLNPEEVPSLCRGVFIVGGEQVTQDIIDTWGDIECLYNFYGPSEVTIGCTVHKRVKKGVKATNIGQPWDNVGAFVLEPGTEKIVLRGAVGELCLFGPLVGQGYLNRPELTAEKFVCLEEFDTRIYRSGDLVRLLHDNSFEFLGRIDDQVKLRGQRLEIREIDHAIKQSNDSIVDVATIVVRHIDQTNEQLAAFFTIRGQILKVPKIETIHSVSAAKVISQVRQHLQNTLPGYMMPTYLLPVTRIPLSANNKADLKPLKALFADMPTRSLQNMDWNGTKILPLTESARKIIRVLAAFFGIPESKIGPSSRLFELGLDSISAVALANILRKEGFTAADGAKVMRKPVVAELADEFDLLEGDDYDQAVEMAEQKIELFRQAHQAITSSFMDIEDFWPCTPLQQDMLSKAINRGDIPFYLSAFHFEFKAPQKINSIRSAWTLAQQKFSILRTVFVEASNKQYVQLVLRKCEVPIFHRMATPEEDPVKILNQKATEWHRRVDVLGQNPCWEVEILEASKGQTYMSLRIFHGLYDANSLLIMLDDVARLIKTRNTKSQEGILQFHKALPFGPLCHRYGAQNFWRSFSAPVLLDIPPILNSVGRSPTMQMAEYLLPEGFIARRNELGVTASAVFQAACLLSLRAKYRIIPTLGLVILGRSFPLADVEKICGPLFNTLPFLVSPKPSWSRKELITACYDFNIDSKPHEHTSLAKIRQWIGLEASRPLFDTLFVFQKEHSGIGDQSEAMWKEVGQNTIPDYPLNLEISLKQDTFKITIVADSEFLSDDNARSLCLNFEDAVKQLIEDPYQRAFPEGYPLSINEPGRLFQLQESIDAHILQQVMSQVAQAAQQDAIAIDDETSVFNLGFDSISLIKLSSALKKIGLDITVNMLMRLSTPARIAGYLANKQQKLMMLNPRTDPSANYPSEATAGFDKARGAFDKGKLNLCEQYALKVAHSLREQNYDIENKRVWPVTSLQEGILGKYDMYYHFSFFKLAPETDTDRLCDACVSVIKTNPVLRTSFVEIEDSEIDEVFTQLVADANENISCTRISLENENEMCSLISAHAEDVSQEGISYSPFRADIITASDTGNRFLMFSMSHAVYDGWSIQLLHQDIFRNYYGQVIQRPPIEPYLEQTLGRSSDDAFEFWTNQMMEYTPQTFPPLVIDLQQAPIPVSHRLSIPSRTDPKRLGEFCMAHAVTMHAFGLAVWTCVLASYVQSNDVCFGIVLACRDTEETEQLMFPTFNTVPFRPSFQGTRSLDLLREIHRLSLDLFEHQYFPLKAIKKLHRSADGLFDTVFIMQKRSSSVESSPKLYEEVEFGAGAPLDYPVNVEMEVAEALTWTVAAKSSVLDEDGVRDLIERLELTIKVILQPDGHIKTYASTGKPEAGLSPSENADLPALTPNPLASEAPVSMVPVNSDIRAMIAETLASVLHLPVNELNELADQSELYRLGLDSINIIKVASRLRRLNISLPSSKILQAGTLGRAVQEARWIARENSTLTTQPPFTNVPKLSGTDELIMHLSYMGFDTTNVKFLFPATAGQVLMLDYYIASRSRLFCHTFQFEIKRSRLSDSDILDAWHAVVEAFPILRTKFVEFQGVIWQAIIGKAFVDTYPPAATVAVFAAPDILIITLRIHHTLYDAVSLPMVIAALEMAIERRSLQLEALEAVQESHLVSENRPDTSGRSLPHFTPLDSRESTEADEACERSPEETLQKFLHITRMQSTGEVRRDFWINYTSPFLKQEALVEIFTPTVRGTFEAPRLAVVEPGLVGNVAPLRSIAAGAGLSLQTLFLAATGRAYAEATMPKSEVILICVYLSNRGLDVPNLDVYPGPMLNVLPLLVHTNQSLEESAKQVQEDLNLIQRAEFCELNLREFHEWTKISIDCFVNWVPALDAIETEDGGSKIKLLPVDDHRGQDLGFELAACPFLYGKGYARPSYCVPTVDIEARVNAEGSLTIGVFAPNDKFGEGSEAKARWLMSEISGALDGFAKSASAP